MEGRSGRVASLTAPLAVGTRGRFVGLVALAPALLLLAHLLPTTGAGLAVRLAAAAACVLLVPGALLLRAIGWPTSPGIALAGSFALSLAVDAFGLALVFAAGGSILLMGIVIGSTFKGLVVGVCSGYFAKKVNSLPWGIVFGLVMGLLFAYLVAAMPDPSGKHYYFEIMLPGSIVGAIVGFATQRYQPATQKVAH